MEGSHLNIMHLVNALPGVAAQGLIWGIMAIGVYNHVPHPGCGGPDGGRHHGHRRRRLHHADHGRRPPCRWRCWARSRPVCWRALATGLFHTMCGIPRHPGRHPDPVGPVLREPADHGQANRPVSSRQYDLLVDQQSVRSLSLDNPILVVAVFVIAIIALLYWFFGTELGASLRATGSNPNMSRPRASTPTSPRSWPDALQRPGGPVLRPAGPVSGLSRT